MSKQPTYEQIHCISQQDEDVIIFDRDNWIENNAQSQKYIGQKNPDPKMLKKIEQEIAASKQQFYKVKIVEKKQLKSTKDIGNVQQKNPIEENQKSKMNNPNNILKQGYLEKKTDGFFFKWNTRFMVLTPEKLYSFENQKKQKVIGCVNLKLLSAGLKTQQYNIILDFEGQCQNLILKCQNKNQLNQWKTLLVRVIEYQSKQNKLFIMTINKPLYDAKDVLAQQQFIQYAETGDILLFHTKHTSAALQRVFTNSDYDHVAMIVKFKKDEVLVFESNPIDGVAIYQWKMFIKYFNLYETATIRKLYSVKKSDLHHCFLNFAKKNIGKKYEISTTKLLKNQTDFDWQGAKKQLDDRGYFCSELIAKAYKVAGLLVDEKKSSTKYWPVDFSQKGCIKLKNGASLGNQQTIILNKHIKKKA